MPGVVIEGVVPGSLAARAGIEAGDLLLAVNGVVPRDILDYQYASTEERVVLSIQKGEDGPIRDLVLHKDLDADLGLVFHDPVFDGMMKCQNRCVFCFVDQMPRHLRRTLYIKDDDYRYSYLLGSFVTLGNLTEQDWQRIEKYHLSPLYISVHATDPRVRSHLVRSRRPHDILGDLKRLADLGIDMHTQIVLCPGWNDGPVLESTISDLSALYPALRSVGIVPVGLTGHRQGLTGLTAITPELARQLIARGWEWQEHYRGETAEGLGLVYLADEFFVQAGEPFPTAPYYDGYPQLENGIGLARIFLDEWEQVSRRLPRRLQEPAKLVIICGESALPVLEPAAARLNQVENLEVVVQPVKNRFFGGRVTVTGLLTGRDIIETLGDRYAGYTILLPRVVLKEGENRLLDEITVEEIARATGCPVRVVDTSARGLLSALPLKRSLPLRRSQGLLR